MALYYEGKEFIVTEEWPFHSPYFWEEKNLNVIVDGWIVEDGTRVHIVKEGIEGCIINNAIVIGHRYTEDVILWGCK